MATDRFELQRMQKRGKESSFYRSVDPGWLALHARVLAPYRYSKFKHSFSHQARSWSWSSFFLCRPGAPAYGLSPFVDLSAWIVRSAIATLVLHFFEYEYHIQTYFINNSQLALSFGNKQTKVPKVALVFQCIWQLLLPKRGTHRYDTNLFHTG